MLDLDDAGTLAVAGQWADWFWSPAFPGMRRVLGICLCALVAYCAFRCVLRRRASGPVSTYELKALNSRSAVFGRVLSAALCVVYPVLLAAGAFLIVFPLSPPSALLLVSRARAMPLLTEPFVLPGKERPDLNGAGALVDLGPVVDDVLAVLESDPAFDVPVSRDDRDVLAKARAAVVEQMKSFSPEAHEVERPVDASKRLAAAKLPAWLVESVEIACLRLAAERRPITAAIVHASGRADRYGESVWLDARIYLSENGAMIRKMRVEIVESSPTRQPATVDASMRKIASNRDIAVRFAIPASSGVGTRRCTVRCTVFDALGDRVGGVTTLDLDMMERPTIQRGSISIPITSPERLPTRIVCDVGGVQTGDVRIRDLDELWNGDVRVIDGGVSGQRLVDAVSGVGASEWMADVAAELAASSGLLAGARFVAGGSPAPNELILDARSRDGVWIYRGLAEPFDPAMVATAISEPQSTPLHFVPSTLGGASAWTLGGFQATPPEIIKPGSAAGHLYAFPIPAATGFQLSGGGKADSRTRSLFVMPDPRSPEFSVLRLGLDVERLGPNVGAPEVAALEAAYWSTASHASLLCLERADGQGGADDSDDSRPALLLEPTDVSAATSSSLRFGAIVFALGLACALIQSLRASVTVAGKVI